MSEKQKRGVAVPTRTDRGARESSSSTSSGRRSPERSSAGGGDAGPEDPLAAAAGPVAGSPIRVAFLRRVRSWAAEIAATAPEQVLADALAKPTARGGLVDVLSRVAFEEELSSATRLREEALARGVAVKEELRERAGGFKPTTWVSEHLGITRQAVDKRRKQGKLLSFATADGQFAFPLCQFTDDGVVPGLEEALAGFTVDDPWMRLSALVNPAPALSGRSVLDVLSRPHDPGERERALAVVRNFLR